MPLIKILRGIWTSVLKWQKSVKCFINNICYGWQQTRCLQMEPCLSEPQGVQSWKETIDMQITTWQQWDLNSHLWRDWSPTQTTLYSIFSSHLNI